MKNIKESLIKTLYECAAACQKCVGGCLSDHSKMTATCVKTDLDCADICLTTATLLARNSSHGRHLLSECIEICKACATECEKHKVQHCIDCAIACRECIAACESYQAA